jgi:hypothetical protein
MRLGRRNGHRAMALFGFVLQRTDEEESIAQE